MGRRASSVGVIVEALQETARDDLRAVEFQNRDGSTSRESVPACCRCGFCCLGERCDVAIDFARGEGLALERAGRCPFLEFNAETSPQASCALVGAGLPAEFIGAGVGCCTKARAVAFIPSRGVVEYRFAVLPDAEKLKLGRLVASGTIPDVHSGAA